MSANNIEIVVAETVTKVAKIKTPTLSGKYIKFLVFGNWFIDRLAVAGTTDEATVETMREQLELFAGVSKQTEMFDLFFQEIKDSTKSMKALIRKHNAPPKKEKKSRAKASVATDGTEIEKKRGRKKKATEVVHDKQDDLVAEIVAAAQGQGTDGSTNPSLVVEQVAEPQPKKKYVRKPKVVLAETETDVVRALEPELVAEQIVEQVAEPVAETETKKKVKAVKKTDEEKLAEKAVKDAEKLAEKEKKDAEKLAEKAKKDAEKLAEKEKKDAEKLAEKTKKDAEKLSAKADKKKKTPPTSPTTHTTPANDDDNDDDDVELDVRKITCASTGISYLLDNDNNVYDINSHNILGKFNLNNLSVNLI
jgi:septal ring factor EnvC (AmiA/AmiB activator)